MTETQVSKPVGKKSGVLHVGRYQVVAPDEARFTVVLSEDGNLSFDGSCTGGGPDGCFV